jgi:predicted GH43/DUF377 family glycosyl hydrolase
MTRAGTADRPTGAGDPMRRHSATIMPDASRTIARPFLPGYPQGFDDTQRSRAAVIVERILALEDEAVEAELADVSRLLGARHRDVESLMLRRFDALKPDLEMPEQLGRTRSLLIGAYFTQEYSFEAAALFNPSAVLHPDQSGLEDGAVRFILSLRAIGEGHVSSLSFRTGVWTPGGEPRIDPAGPTTQAPEIEFDGDGDPGLIKLHCGGSRLLSETVLFPITPHQKQGIEDVRLVRFVEDDGSVCFYGTYTAFDGMDARSELLVSGDFHDFQIRALAGDAIGNKGMALFPRRVDGRYAMLGRQDNENIWLLQSDELTRWSGGVRVIRPRYAWEYVQMGNCGSPIEIDEGWLVLTHGVGKIRNYAIGACLLDKRDPSRLIARTPQPILSPTPDQRDGYVPNVVYSCGALAVGRALLLPYAVADTFTAFASTTVDALLRRME